MLNWLKKYKTPIGIILSVFFLYLAFRKISWKDMEVMFSATSFRLLSMVVLLNIVARIAIVFRWKLLLYNEKKVGFTDTFNYMNIGYFINNILPARTGDFVKAVLLAKKNDLSKTSCIASVAVERLFDMVGLGMVFIVSLIVLKLPLYLKQGGFAILIFAGVLLILIVILSEHSETFYARFSKLSNHKTFLYILRRIEMLLSYSYILRNKVVLLGILTTTVISWFLYVFTGYIILDKIAPGPFSWHVSLLSLLIISVSFVLPTTPGNLGVYQFACVLAFSIAGLPKEPAIVFSLISQLPVYFLSLGLGLYSMWIEGFNLKSLKVRTLSAADEK